MPRLITMIFGFMVGLALLKKKHGHSDRKQSGLLKPETRPALSPEERTKMVESLIFSWPSAHSTSATLYFAQVEDLPTHT
ncbi:hypothetical protein AL073_02745 [Loktanella sp. 1ANDIMAR09]|nr:hypothetical protein AL073_02745 [Loktanella sp. 1ANDIMAR09]